MPDKCSPPPDPGSTEVFVVGITAPVELELLRVPGWLLFQPEFQLDPVQLMDVIAVVSFELAQLSVADSEGRVRVMIEVEYTLGSQAEVRAMVVAETLLFGETDPGVGTCKRP